VLSGGRSWKAPFLDGQALAWTLADQGKKAEAADEFRRVIELTQDDAVRKASEEALKRPE